MQGEDGLPAGVTRHDAKERLRSYVSGKLGAGDLRVVRFERLPGGYSNQTFELVVAEGADGPALELIVRWDPEIGLVEPYDMGLQFRIMESLQESAVPVPRTYWLEEDPSVLGRAFYVVGKVEATIGNRVIGGADAASQERKRREYVNVLAAIHSTDWQGLGMDRFMQLPGPGATYALREVERWERVIDRKLAQPDEVLAASAAWMRANAIDTDEVCLLHGDCSGANYMWNGERIAAVIDWEMSTLGDPMVEIGWYCGCIETLGVSEDGLRPAEITEARHAFLTTYAQVTGRTLDVDKIRFGEVFYNYQLCSVTVSGQWMRRQTSEVLPEAQSAGPSFRNELERLIA